MLLAGFSAIYLTVLTGGRDPDALKDSQERVITSLAKAMSLSITADIADLRTGAKVMDLSHDRDPGQVLDDLAKGYPKWKNLALLDSANGKQVTARGEQIPMTAIPVLPKQPTVYPVVNKSSAPKLLVAIPVAGKADQGYLLLAYAPVRNPELKQEPEVNRTLLLVDNVGQVLTTTGQPLDQSAQASNLLDLATKASSRGEHGTLDGQRTADGQEYLASYEPIQVDGLAGRLGISLISIVRAPTVIVPTNWDGLIPAAALWLITLAGFVIVRQTLVLPIKALRADALNIADGHLDDPVRPHTTQEASTIATTLERIRAGLLLTRPVISAPGKRSPVLVAVGAVTGLLLAWSAGTLLLFGMNNAPVPSVLVGSSKHEASTLADAVRRSMAEGLSDVKALTTVYGNRNPQELQGLLDSMIKDQTRYRSLYIVDAAGKPVAGSGRDPLRPLAPLPKGEGISQGNTSGRLPVIYSYSPFPGGKFSAVAEFDVDHLTTMLKRAGGHAVLVDSGMRTIADTEGFLAFDQIQEPGLVSSVQSSRKGQTVSGVQQVGTQRKIVAAAALTGSASVSGLKWTLVSEQPISDLRLTGNDVAQHARVIAVVGALLSALMFGWHYFMLIRPLRRVADMAAELDRGDLETVIYPQRQDEVGTIARCLEISRQAAKKGPVAPDRPSLSLIPRA
ncbi:HAMP domain-containing protein [Pseudonocardiaceae bacterium YIM PH 21723]|nr:HAMP domain-containing protein [Pseudonocardiaceae bacterium YIM PH 21723]